MKYAVSLLILLLSPFFTPPDVQAQPPGPQEVVERFHAALKDQKKEDVLKILSEDIIIFEDGSSEMSLDEYASHHLEADMKFSAGAQRKVLQRETFSAGEAPVVMSVYRVKARVRGNPTEYENAETVILERHGDDWRISHIHWSTRKLR
ncbi:MAG: nuclear transport factor 2 family protein [bacterium]|nr:MAG: nuclear transport factor 2 family protein [bacterium]